MAGHNYESAERQAALRRKADGAAGPEHQGARASAPDAAESDWQRPGGALAGAARGSARGRRGAGQARPVGPARGRGRRRGRGQARPVDAARGRGRRRVQAKHDLSVQREEAREEDEVQAQHDQVGPARGRRRAGRHRRRRRRTGHGPAHFLGARWRICARLGHPVRRWSLASARASATCASTRTRSPTCSTAA